MPRNDRREVVLRLPVRTRETMIFSAEDIEALAEALGLNDQTGGRNGSAPAPEGPERYPMLARAGQAIRESAVFPRTEYVLAGSPSSVDLLIEEMVDRNPQTPSLTEYAQLALYKTPRLKPGVFRVRPKEDPEG